VIRELQDFGCDVSVTDYWADAAEVKHEYNLDLVGHSVLDTESMQEYDAVVLAVAHNDYKALKLDSKNQVVFDIKSILDQADGRL
jgi:UDP-N-acetyl-D-galactosamine dehydrogenase